NPEHEGRGDSAGKRRQAPVEGPRRLLVSRDVREAAAACGRFQELLGADRKVGHAHLQRRPHPASRRQDANVLQVLGAELLPGQKREIAVVLAGEEQELRALAYQAKTTFLARGRRGVLDFLFDAAEVFVAEFVFRERLIRPAREDSDKL